METQIIQATGILLGIISPVALLYVLAQGVQAVTWNQQQKRVFWRQALFSVIGWTALLFALTFAGVFEYREGDIIPRFLVGLVLPVGILLIIYFRSSFQEVLNVIPLHVIVGAQFFRIFGAVFLLMAKSGMGPQDFVSAGYGDIATGILAIAASILMYQRNQYGMNAAWLFTGAGMLDLLNVSRILLTNYPIWSDANPSTALAGSFPMMLVLGITAPIAIALHIYAVSALVRQPKIVQS